MHKRIKVMEMELDIETGCIKKLGAIDNKEHLPVGVLIKKGLVDRAALNEWWLDRYMPVRM